jgi:hypothetical protein
LAGKVFMPEFKCEQCGKAFEQEESMRQHVQDKHAQPQPEPQAQPSAHQHPDHHDHHAHKDSHSHAHPRHEPHKVKLKVSKTVLYTVVAAVVIGGGGFAAYSYASSLPQPASDSGQASTGSMGAVGSTHIHADLGLYLDGQEITPLPLRYFVRHAAIHVESGDGAGSVVHMHSTNTPLGFFFRTLGMSFNNECFRLDNGREYCSGEGKTLKMYVKHFDGDWQESRQFHTYVFEDLDKILITYGDETPEEIQAQQDSVTDFSKDNADRQMDLSNLPR